jgi:hypothetical protein
MKHTYKTGLVSNILVSFANIKLCVQTLVQPTNKITKRHIHTRNPNKPPKTDLLIHYSRSIRSFDMNCVKVQHMGSK